MMTCCGAKPSPLSSTASWTNFATGKSISAALESPRVSGHCARQFVRRTFDYIDGGNLCAIASAFTFGREDLLPAVFQRIVDELNVEAGGGLEDFKYYLERHIGLDGKEHGPMANRLLLALCGSDESLLKVAEQTAVDCLKARLAFWDSICDMMRREKNTVFRR